jgi:dTDP-4-dehydrorhamnose reductase
MDKTVLISGGAGMLATDLKPILEEKGCRVVSLKRTELDITSPDRVREVCRKVNPGIIINTAVYHVEPCEDSPEQGYAVNAFGPECLAKTATELGAEFVQISTCGLFGDEVREYHEYDEPVLKTVYAKSKYEGEVAALRYCPQSYVIRLGWLFGGKAEHARNFVAARIREGRGDNKMKSAGDKYGSPTYTGDAARCLLRIIEKKAYGVTHVANTGIASRADYVEACLRADGNPKDVERVDSSHFPRKADVPACEALMSFRLRYAGLEPLPDWREALQRYVHETLDSSL